MSILSFYFGYIHKRRSANRTQQYFKYYFNSLTEDMPNVETSKDPVSDKVYLLLWRPQKDCFNLDGNFGDYLQAVYE